MLFRSGTFLKAHLLLALLYIHAEEWDKALNEVKRVLAIDVNNTMGLRYKKEIEIITTIPEDRELQKKRKKNRLIEDIVKYQSGNETIIQPINGKEKGASTILFAFVTGVCIGLAVVIFLILPAQVSNAKQQAKNEIKTIGEVLAMKTSEIVGLQQQIESLQTENNKIEEELGNYKGTDGKLRANDQLLLAATEYMIEKTNYLGVADYLEQVESSFLQTEASEAFIVLYDQMVALVGEEEIGRASCRERV